MGSDAPIMASVKPSDDVVSNIPVAVIISIPPSGILVNITGTIVPVTGNPVKNKRSFPEVSFRLYSIELKAKLT